MPVAAPSPPKVVTSGAPVRRGPSWTGLVLAAVVALALGGGAVWAFVAGPLSGDGTFTAAGTVAVHDLASRSHAGLFCESFGKNTDVKTGTQVVVTDGASKTVALGAIVGDGRSGEGTVCNFRFEVPSVPGGLGIYGVEIKGHGRVEYTEVQMRAGVSMSID